MNTGAVLVGVPALEQIPTVTVAALGELRSPLGLKVRYELGGLCSIAYKRNHLVEAMLADPRFGFLYFCDHDNPPPPDAVERLLAHDRDIVGGLYFGRVPPFLPQVGRTDIGGLLAPLEKLGGLQEVDICGTGSLLVRRSVFERIPRPWFAHPFPDPVSHAGEDSYFCKRATGAGIKIFCDTDLIIPHLATIAVDQDFAFAWRQTAAARQWDASTDPPAELEKIMREIRESQRAITTVSPVVPAHAWRLGPV